jgi:hypothetical protein
MAFLGDDAELGVGGAIALVAAAAFDDLEEEAFAAGRTVELKILAVLVLVIGNARAFQVVEEVFFLLLFVWSGIAVGIRSGFTQGRCLRNGNGFRRCLMLERQQGPSFIPSL